MRDPVTRKSTARKKTSARCSCIVHFCCCAFIVPCFVLGGALAAQEVVSGVPAPASQLPIAPGALLQAQGIPPYAAPTAGRAVKWIAGDELVAKTPEANDAAGGPRVITLEEAEQEAAAAAGNPMVRLGELQVEVARQNRLVAESSFFPQVASTFENFHFNKFMGQLVEVNRPIAGTVQTVGVPLVGKDQTFLTVTGTQPITPLLQLRQLYKIAVADENIARAKAGMPVAETASKVEQNYYALLVAERQLIVAKLKAKNVGAKWLMASSTAPVISAGHDQDLIETSKMLAVAGTKVKELTASLNDLLGLPSETELKLVPPETRMEDISLEQLTSQAMTANPEVIEAEQTVIKARAAATAQKLTYVPVVAVMGGYAYNNKAIPLLPGDFSFIGVIATYNVFDFGKREHTIKGAETQQQLAELALQLTKAKVAGAVKSSYLEMQGLRQLSQLMYGMDREPQLQRASYENSGADEDTAKKATVEAEMYKADSDYRQAVRKLNALIGAP